MASPDLGAPPETSACPSHIQVIWDVALFFVINVFAHCLTMREFPGQQTSRTIVRAFYMVISPVSAGGESFQIFLIFIVASWRRCRLPSHQKPNSTIDWLAYGDDCPLDAAIRAQAVAICVPAEYAHEANEYGAKLRNPSIQKIVFVDGQKPTEEELRNCRLVPALATTDSALQVVPQSAIVKNAVGIFQLAYSSFELFYGNWSTMRHQGLSSPYIVVVPYILMSFINLVVNLMIPSYPYVTILRPLGPPPMYAQTSPHASRGSFYSAGSRGAYGSEDGTPLLPRSPGHYTFDVWVERTHGIRGIRNSRMDSYRYGEFINIVFCTALITGVIYLMTLFRIPPGNTLLCAALLCWVYTGVVGSAVIFVTEVFKGLPLGMASRMSARAVSLAGTGFGAYFAIKQLYDVYSTCQ